MKKMILSLVLAAVTLCSCGVNVIDTDKKDNDNNTEIRFIQENNIEYNNGCIYGSKPAMYLDFETLKSTPLCALPNCMHNKSDCLANMVGNTPIFYNDYIYFFESNYGAVRETKNGPEFYIDSKLKKASIDSSQIDVVCEFSDAAPVQGFIGIVLKGSKIYFAADDLNPELSPYGSYGWGNSGGNHFLCSIDLDTGEYKNYGSIYDGDKEYDGAEYSSCANITGVYNDTMYIRYSFIKDNQALQSGGGKNLDELYEHLNFEFDFDNETWKESELPFSWSMNNETYTYYDAATSLEHVIYKGEDKTFPLDDSGEMPKEYNGLLFLEKDKSKFYDLETMTEYSMGKYSDYRLMGYSDGSYIFTNSLEYVKLTEEELKSL